MALEIEINPPTGRIGDVIEINATTGNFTYPLFNKNVVTFNGLNIDVIAKIIRSDSSISLLVVVPPDSITGTVTVETSENETATTEFEVLYDDITFTQESKPYNKATINKKVKSVGTDAYKSPVYNKDLSYSNFVEVTDENSMLQNVYTIILTQKGERLFSDFGTNIDQKLFSIIDDEEIFKAELMKEIITAVNTYETRVSIVEDESFIVINDESVYLILMVAMPTGNVRELGITLKSVTNIDR